MCPQSNFYFISSNDSLDLYPNNHPADFSVHLPIPLFLSENWEMGLLDFSLEAEFITLPKEIYVCVNVLDSSYVCGNLSKVLKRISIPKEFRGKLIFYFPCVNYVPITSNYLNYFQVKIFSETFQEAAFKKGNLYGTLHLRKC